MTVDDGVLTLRGERKHEREVTEENYHRVERAWGSFQRSIRLPSDAESDKVKASYESGVLKVTVPKTEPPKPRSVTIAVETAEEQK